MNQYIYINMGYTNNHIYIKPYLTVCKVSIALWRTVYFNSRVRKTYRNQTINISCIYQSRHSLFIVLHFSDLIKTIKISNISIGNRSRHSYWYEITIQNPWLIVVCSDTTENFCWRNIKQKLYFHLKIVVPHNDRF